MGETMRGKGKGYGKGQYGKGKGKGNGKGYDHNKRHKSNSYNHQCPSQYPSNGYSSQGGEADEGEGYVTPRRTLAGSMGNMKVSNRIIDCKKSALTNLITSMLTDLIRRDKLVTVTTEANVAVGWEVIVMGRNDRVLEYSNCLNCYNSRVRAK